MAKQSQKKIPKVHQPPPKVPFSERTLGSFKPFVALVSFLDLPEQETFFPAIIRAGVKRFFDFLRNVMISGLILFLGYKAKNPTVIFIGKCSIYLLVLSLWTYFDPYVLKISIKTKQVRVGQIVSVILRLLVGILISLGIGYVVVEVVMNIAVSYVG